MKTVQRSSKASSSHIFEEYKSIDSSSVPVTTLKLSARIRNQQRRQVKTNKISVEKLKDISKLAEPKPNCQQPDRRNHWKITKNVLNYKASKRIQSLAKPRSIHPKVSETMSSQGSFQSTVSAKALNYVPTQRILELARPRRYNIITDLQLEPDDDYF